MIEWVIRTRFSLIEPSLFKIIKTDFRPGNNGFIVLSNKKQNQNK